MPTQAPSARTLARSLQQITGLSPAQVSSRPVCPRATPGRVTCGAQALVLRSNGALVRPHVSRHGTLGRVTPASARGGAAVAPSAATPPAPGTPGYLQQAYDLAYLSQKDSSSDTVAIVDAFNDPSAEADLALYRSTYGLGLCSTGNGCFQKVGQDGSSSLPAPNPAWEREISLDLDAVSAICPTCHILLVEANSDTFSDLEAAMATAAATPGVKQMVASWWATTSDVPAGLPTGSPAFPGVATVAATGDQGYPGAGQNNYPAALPGVTAAGGTSLAAAAAPGARGFGESAWSWNGLTGGGSGCDRHFQRPAYQPAAGCVGRAYADLSADGNPDTGLQVYDSQSGWTVVGGTSLAAPLVAAYYAISGVDGSTPGWAYGKAGLLNDVLSGSTGACAASIAYICNAGAGYDGPTGVGSISGSVVTGAPGIDGPAVPAGQGQGNTYTQSVAPHGATIAGGIYRNGLDTRWWIEYGSDNTYGSQTAPVDIGAGSAPVSVTGYLSQLAPGTPYHYRLVAQSSLGTTYGYDYAFTTPAAPAGAPTAAFTVSPGSPAPGDLVSFDASASAPSGSITGYTWNFGDGSAPETDPTPQTHHRYAARGTYTVTLTVKTADGQTDATTQTVTVDDPPTAAFAASPSAVPAGNPVSLDASGSNPGAGGGSITDYSWDFGDGTSAVDGGADATASHTFTDPGTYTVTLTTTDDLHAVSTTTQQITVAEFKLDSAIPTPGSPVTFTPLSTAPAGQTITGYTWHYGDGTSDPPTTDQTIQHTYSHRGTFTVSLNTQYSDGTSSNSAATVIVDTPPTAAFTPSITAFRPGTTVSFDAGGSHAATGGRITDYAWSFGDGSPVDHTGTTTTTITHPFTSPGVYTVTLTTTDDLGASAIVSQQVTADDPTAAFTITSSSAPAPNSPVTFDASATDDPESTITDYAWDFGDHSSPVHTTTPIITHPFSAVGPYTVKLTVTDQFGFTDTTSRQVVVAAAVTGSSNPPTTPTPPAPVVTTPTPTPPLSGTTTLALLARLSGGGHQPLTRVLSHGIHLGLVVNQRVQASWQVTVPLAQTKQTRHGVRRAKDNGQLIVVLLRRAQTLAAGTHTITLRLSRAAIQRLATRGSLVLTIHVTLKTTDGRSLTRTASLTLTR